MFLAALTLALQADFSAVSRELDGVIGHEEGYPAWQQFKVLEAQLREGYARVLATSRRNLDLESQSLLASLPVENGLSAAEHHTG